MHEDRASERVKKEESRNRVRQTAVWHGMVIRCSAILLSLLLLAGARHGAAAAAADGDGTSADPESGKGSQVDLADPTMCFIKLAPSSKRTMVRGSCTEGGAHRWASAWQS